MLLPCKSEDRIEVGIDEVGRGSLAGRLYVAAVIWPHKLTTGLATEIKDSKKLSKKKKDQLFDYIKENAIAYSIQYREVEEIDVSNILKITLETMHICLDTINSSFDHILADGNKFYLYKDIPHECIIGGDNKYISIAAASILAKVSHDRHMEEIAKEYPNYGWDTNQGYGSQKHRDAIKQYGVTKYHRRSYNPVRTWLEEGSVEIIL